MINRERLVKTFCELVRVDSPSGEEEERRADEAEASRPTSPRAQSRWYLQWRAQL